ncbi:MAG: 16S rRNA (adenine(1518)-N(6)/adenine(1519)-N(6))-dimethyltransferase RsmA [Myxococcaceae bacterium]
MADHDSPAELLRKHGLHAKHSWGQNFLGDPQILAKIAEAAQLQPGETAVELGAGLGHLTRALLASGANVVAVERDRDMVRVLEGQKLERLKVVSANAADIDFAEVAGTKPVAVIGNLPYHLSSPILFQVLDQHVNVKRAVFTLQKEVVTRLAAAPDSRDYGLLSVLLGLHFEVEELFHLPARMFHPPPKVDSAVVLLTHLEKPRAPIVDDARFRRVVKAGFAQRRKTLINSLKSDKQLATPEQYSAALATAGIDPRRRAETLSVEEFVAIERALGPIATPR